MGTLELYGVEGGQCAEAIPSANVELLLAILTFYIRGDRFCDGLLDSVIQEGKIAAILKRLRELHEGKEHAEEQEDTRNNQGGRGMDLHLHEFLEHLAALGEEEATRNLAEYHDKDKLAFVESVLDKNPFVSSRELTQARKHLEELADKKNRGAMQVLGNMYYTGRMGYEQDYAKAREWYEKAAALGDSWALCNLGYIYYYGRGVEIDYEKAFSLFERSAYKGNHNAIYKVGDHYYNGYFVKRNYESAFYWYQRAREAAERAVNGGSDCPELPNILYRLGLCFSKGHGVSEDLVLSLHYLGKAEPMFYHKILADGDLFAKETLQKTQKLLKAVRSRLDALTEGKDDPGKKRGRKSKKNIEMDHDDIQRVMEAVEAKRREMRKPELRFYHRG
jgi:TPR repeat protein